MIERREIGVGAVGFGRIGREVLQQTPFVDADRAPEVELKLKGVVSRKEFDQYEPLVIYDSKFPGNLHKVERHASSVVVDGKQFEYLKLETGKGNDTNLWNWRNLGVDVVFDTSGRAKKEASHELASIHLLNGAKAVVFSCPSPDALNVVVGVNDEKINSNIVSAASCTTNCGAPPTKVMLDNFGAKLESISGITIHTTTGSNDQSIDAPNAKDPSRGRSASRNIIPTSTGAAKAIKQVIPEISELQIPTVIKAQRVPLQDVSLVDLSFTLSKGYKTTEEEIAEMIIEASLGKMKGVIEIAPQGNLGICSSMFAGSKATCMIDLSQIQVEQNRLVRIVAYYDNETAFTNKMLSVGAIVASKL